MAAISGNLQPVVFEFLRGHVSSLMLQEMERMSVTCTSMLSRENHIFFLAMLNLAQRRNIQYQSLVGPH